MSETPETLAAEVAAPIVGAVTEAVQQAVSENERAETVAKEIAAAAMENERGQRVANVEREISECRTLISEMEPRLMAQVEMLLRETLSAVADANAVALAELSARLPQQTVLTPPISEPEPAAPVVIVDPANPPPPEKEAAPPVVKKKRRFL